MDQGKEKIVDRGWWEKKKRGKRGEKKRKVVWGGYVSHHQMKFTKIKIIVVLAHKKLSQNIYNNWGVKSFICQKKIKYINKILY